MVIHDSERNFFLETVVKSCINTQFVFCGCLLAAILALAPAIVRAEVVNEYGKYGAWPSTEGTRDWMPINSLNDPYDGNPLTCEFVGNNTWPCGYWATNWNYIFFRARVAADSTTFRCSILVLVDAVGSGPENVPETAFAWDSKSQEVNHGLELMITNVVGASWGATDMSDVDGQSGQKIAPPDFAYGPTATEGFIRVTSGNAMGTTNTTFIDWAVSFDVITNKTRTKLSLGTWKIQFGSINDATDHNKITTDVAANTTPSTALASSWSETFEIIGKPTGVNGVAISPSQINLSWAKNSAANNVLVAYNTSATFGTPVDGTAYTSGSIPGGGTVIYNGEANGYDQTTGLSPNTPYYYKVWSVDPKYTYYSTGAATGPITTTPEPGVCVLAGLALLGLRRRAA